MLTLNAGNANVSAKDKAVLLALCADQLNILSQITDVNRNHTHSCATTVGDMLMKAQGARSASPFQQSAADVRAAQAQEIAGNPNNSGRT